MSERWWFWMFLTAITANAVGYAAASGPAMFVASLPFGAGGVIYGSLETARLVREERSSAIREAARIARRVQRMGPVT